MKQELEKIKEWNQIFDIPQHDKPTMAHRDDAMDKFHLLYEELLEYRNTLKDEDLTKDEKLISILYSLVIMQTLVLGTVRLFGFQDVFEDAFAEVHLSKLSMLENGVPLKKEDGRIIEGKFFIAPDLKQFIK